MRPSPNTIIKGFLEAREALIQKDLPQKSGRHTSLRYTALIDNFVRALFRTSGIKDRGGAEFQQGHAVLALGSYGRQEMCLGSDVDLMVIHHGRLSSELAHAFSRAIYPLWDVKLDVGHSILTVPECIRLALQDFRVLTSLMDARFLLGSKALFDLFREAFWSRIGREKEGLLKQFLIHEEDREDRFDTEAFFVEPDIKEGRGGLRDIHLMEWMAKTYFNCQRLGEIRRFALFSRFDFHKLSLSKSFLLRVRNHLHRICGRREDRILLPHQQALSILLGYGDGPEALERCLRDLHFHLNRVHFGHQEFMEKALEVMEPSSQKRDLNGLCAEFQVIRGNIVLRDQGAFRKDPLLILVGLREANERGLFLGSDFIWEGRKRISQNGKALTRNAQARGLFLDLILQPANPKITRLVLEMGLMELFIPEFRRIRNLAQHGFYHIRTVDLHSLRTVDVLCEIRMGVYDRKWPLLSRLYEGLMNPQWLFLACLLHDIGKGYPGNHSEKGGELIPRILKRFGISDEASEVISLLVRHHLLLANVSQRRDLGEERTSVQVAQHLKDPEILSMLFLLTVADSLATGPIASSDWKMMLLMELFFKVQNIVERGTLATADATEKMERQRQGALTILEPKFSQEDIIRIMDQASSRYFLNTPIKDICRHIRLALTLGESPFSWALEKLEAAPVTRVTLCIHDRPGLFSKMVGVFTLNNMGVLSANIFTLKNGLAFDIYEVTNPLDVYRETEQWEKIYGEILLALEDQLPLDDLINEKERSSWVGLGLPHGQQGDVKIRNEISDFFTVVEVRSRAEVGALYDLAKALFGLGLDIRFAKVNADREKMTGVFYVRDIRGEKVYEEAQLRLIKEGISAVIK